MELQNAHYTLEWAVTEEKTAKNVGSGDVAVFATPMLVALAEAAAVACLRPFLEEGQTSVGAFIGISHTAATPVGMKASATVRVTAVEGKKIEFAVAAFDEQGSIGEGTHTRFLVNRQRFEQKAAEKIK